MPNSSDENRRHENTKQDGKTNRTEASEEESRHIKETGEMIEIVVITQKLLVAVLTEVRSYFQRVCKEPAEGRSICTTTHHLLVTTLGTLLAVRVKWPIVCVVNTVREIYQTIHHYTGGEKRREEEAAELAESSRPCANKKRTERAEAASIMKSTTDTIV